MLQGTVRLLFQPAEEGGAGGDVMVKEGALAGAKAAFGMHVWCVARLTPPLLGHSLCFATAAAASQTPAERLAAWRASAVHGWQAAGLSMHAAALNAS